MTAELVAIAVYLVTGVAVLRAFGLTGWALAPLGFLAGVGLHIATTTLLIVVFLPTAPVVVFAVDLAVAALSLWWARRAGRSVAVSWKAAAAVGAGVGAAVVAFRALNLARWHVDSIQYLDAGALLAVNRYSDAAGEIFITKRMVGTPAIHAPATLVGEYYLTSVTPLIALAGLAAIVWFLTRGLEGRASARTITLYATLAVVVLVTTNRFVFHALYLNGHLLAGMFVVAIAGSAWLLMLKSRPVDPALVALASVATVALVVTRPEGAALAALALGPLVAHGAAPLWVRKTPFAALAAAMLAWQGFTWIAVLRAGGEPPAFAVAQTAAAAVALAALALPVWRWLARRSALLVAGLEVALWAAVLVLGLRAPAIVTDSITATWANRLAGKWGYTLVLLTVLVIAVLLTLRLARATPMRLSVTGFVPLALLLALVRDGQYRVGQYDSLNRMWLHVLPVAVMFVAAALAGGEWRAWVTKAGKRLGLAFDEPSDAR